MFQEVRKKAPAATPAHYASFIMNYLKKQPATVPSIVCGCVLQKCSDALVVQALDVLAEISTLAT